MYTKISSPSSADSSSPPAAPYRVLLYTMVGVVVALAAVTLYIYEVIPLLAEAPPSETHTSHISLRMLLRGTLLLSFVLICLLLFIGLTAAAREFLKRRLDRQRQSKTVYVDAWKLAGERMTSAPPVIPPLSPPPSPSDFSEEEPEDDDDTIDEDDDKKWK